MHFFLLRAPTHHSFTLNLRFLYELKHKIRLSKSVWDFYFRLHFVLTQVYIFVQQEGTISLTLKRHNSFQNEISAAWIFAIGFLKNLKKMLRKSPASNVWAAIFENADFS